MSAPASRGQRSLEVLGGHLLFQVLDQAFRASHVRVLRGEARFHLREEAARRFQPLTRRRGARRRRGVARA